jgi:hypothetical protein
MAVGIRYADHMAYPQKLTLTSPANGDRSVGIVSSRAQTTEFIWIKLIKVTWLQAVSSLYCRASFPKSSFTHSRDVCHVHTTRLLHLFQSIRQRFCAFRKLLTNKRAFITFNKSPHHFRFMIIMKMNYNVIKFGVLIMIFLEEKILKGSWISNYSRARREYGSEFL